MEKQRKIQIEIVRIIAMFMIVLGHAFTHGNAMDSMGGVSCNSYKNLLCPRNRYFCVD